MPTYTKTTTETVRAERITDLTLPFVVDTFGDAEVGDYLVEGEDEGEVYFWSAEAFEAEYGTTPDEEEAATLTIAPPPYAPSLPVPRDHPFIMRDSVPYPLPQPICEAGSSCCVANCPACR